MAEINYYIAISVDGYIAKENGSFDCFLMEGPHATDFFERLKGFDDVLMGKNTYQIGLDAGVTEPYPGIKHHVISRSITQIPNENVALINEDPISYIKELKSNPDKSIWLCGGGELAALLLNEKLIDKITVKINPVVLGSGIPLFSTIDTDAQLTLESSEAYDNGVVLLSYNVNQ